MIERLESGLSAEMRQLIASARGADDPSAEDEARVKARWLASIAAGAGVSSLAEAAHAAAGAGWGLKVAGVAAAVAAASAGLYLGWPATSGIPTTRSIAARSASARDIQARDVSARHVSARHVSARDASEATQWSHGAAELGGGAAQVGAAQVGAAQVGAATPASDALLAPRAAEAVRVEPEATKNPTVADVNHAAGSAKGDAPEMPEGSRAGSTDAVRAQTAPLARAVSPVPSRVAGSSPKARLESTERASANQGSKLAPAEAVKAPSDLGGQLGEEINMLSRVRTSIQSGESNQALELLGEYGQRFEHPNLAMEADALRIDALCGAGQREAAREHAAHFVATWPGSPLEQRVRDACP